MAHPNLKIQKEKEYNLFVSRTVKRETVGRVKCFIKAVKPNPKDVFGDRKAVGMWYNKKGTICMPNSPSAEQFNSDTVYFYEVGANDGSYRKCMTREDADKRFAQLVEFEKRQTEIK